MKMETSFFKSLKELKIAGKWYLVVKMTGNADIPMTVIVIREEPGDETQKMLSPIMLEGSAEDLDERFFSSIESGIEKKDKEKGE
jgi:PRTRC genetic system protein E